MAKKKALPKQDFSGWTFQPTDDSGKPINPNPVVPDAIHQAIQAVIQKDVTPGPNTKLPPPPEPDILNQDPHTFASLSAQKQRANEAGFTGEDYNRVYEKALEESNRLQVQREQQLAQANLEIEKAKKLEPLEIKKATDLQRAQFPIQEAQKRIEAQLAEGLTMDQAQEQFESADPKNKGQTAPIISKLDPAERAKAVSAIQSFRTLTDIHNGFLAQHGVGPGQEGTAGAGNVITGTLFKPITDIASPQAIAYNSLIDNSITPLARGLGDTGSSLSVPEIQRQIRASLPVIQDTREVGGSKIWLKQNQILEQLQSQRDMLVGHQDVSSLNNAIADMRQRMESIKEFNPLKLPSNVVQEMSPQTRTGVTAGATAGVTPAPGASPTPTPAAIPQPQVTQPAPVMPQQSQQPQTQYQYTGGY